MANPGAPCLLQACGQHNSARITPLYPNTGKGCLQGFRTRTKAQARGGRMGTSRAGYKLIQETDLAFIHTVPVDFSAPVA